jgi:thiamine biosynthesis lipoprotein
VLVRAQEIARASGGAFDVTVGPLTRLWREARRAGRLPLTAALDDAREITGFSLLQLDPHRRTLWFQKSGMSLDLGGIGKGYAADAALAELAERGITRALVDLGGDLSLGDAPPGRAGWRVQVGGEGPLLLARRGVATSGDLEQFVEIEGVRYSHILDPRTGIGLTDRGRVTVISRHCIDADAFASAHSVLDPDAGLELIEKQPFTAARIERVIDGRLQVFRSPELSAPGPGDPPVLR